MLDAYLTHYVRLAQLPYLDSKSDYHWDNLQAADIVSENFFTQKEGSLIYYRPFVTSR